MGRRYRPSRSTPAQAGARVLHPGELLEHRAHQRRMETHALVRRPCAAGQSTIALRGLRTGVPPIPGALMWRSYSPGGLPRPHWQPPPPPPPAAPQPARHHRFADPPTSTHRPRAPRTLSQRSGPLTGRSRKAPRSQHRERCHLHREQHWAGRQDGAVPRHPKWRRAARQDAGPTRRPTHQYLRKRARATRRTTRGPSRCAALPKHDHRLARDPG